MGWASGSELAENIWNLFRDFVPKDTRKQIALKLINLFKGRDCDTIDECEQLCKDAEQSTWRNK